MIPETEAGSTPVACAGCCSARARSTTTCSPSARSGGDGPAARPGRDRAPRAARPAAGVRRSRGRGRVPAGRARLGAGGAGQPGRVAVHGAEPAAHLGGRQLAACPARRPRRRPPARTRSTRPSSARWSSRRLRALTADRRTGRPCTSPTAASRSSRRAGARRRSRLAVARRAAAGVRRPQPGVRGPRRAAGHLAGPPRRRSRRLAPPPASTSSRRYRPFAVSVRRTIHSPVFMSLR